MDRPVGDRPAGQLQLARAVSAAPHSGIREIGNLAASVPGAIRLDLGQPDFPTPAHVVEAAFAAARAGWTGYTATAGLPGLRKLIAAKIATVNGYDVDPAQVVTAPGGVGVIAAAFAATLEPGDEVLVPDPGWPQYELMAAWTNARLVRYACPAGLAYQPDLDSLRALVSPRSRLLVVNSPNNPTGAVYPDAVVEALVEFAQRHDLWLLSDECYDQVVFDALPLSPARLDPERVISAYTFSKTYAMTGWRLGYLAGAPALIDSVTKVLESQSSCAPSISQKAGEAALAGPQDCVQMMVSAYRERRDQAVGFLRGAGLLLGDPEGAFYVMADIRASGMPARDFAIKLLRDKAVAVAPGTAFGPAGEGTVRVSLASSPADISEGLTRIGDSCR